MSNKSSDSLFRLVKTMTRAEKRYFKIFSSRHVIGGTNNYLTLFNIIEKMEEYDEDKVFKKLKEKQTDKRLSILKNRLYNAILKSLDAFHCNNGIEVQLQRQLHSVKILYEKSLVDQALKVLKSTEKIAEKNKHHLMIVAVQEWKKKLIEKAGCEELAVDDVYKDARQRSKEAFDYMNLSNELWMVRNEMNYRLSVFGKARCGAESKVFNELMKKAEVIFKSMPDSQDLKCRQRNIQSLYYYAMNDNAASYSLLKDSLVFFGKNKNRCENNLEEYISTLSRAIRLNVQMQNWKDAHTLIAKLQHLLKKHSAELNDEIEFLKFCQVNCSELMLHVKSWNFEDGIALAPRIEHDLAKYEFKLSRSSRIEIKLSLAFVYFGAGNYRDALKWLNELLNEDGADKYTSIYSIARILNLMVHFELGHRDLLPYLLRSTQRFLETRNILFGCENTLLRFIYESQKKSNSALLPELCERLISNLDTLKSNSFESAVFDYFDFSTWAKCKLDKLKFSELHAA